jgi:hypothetical protein
LIQSNDTQKPFSCEEVAKNATRLRAGMQESQVTDLIGVPVKRFDNEWIYPFYAVIPSPKAGQKIIIGIGVIFENGKVIDIKYATIARQVRPR